MLLGYKGTWLERVVNKAPGQILVAYTQASLDKVDDRLGIL
jgi:hypothetical protein